MDLTRQIYAAVIGVRKWSIPTGGGHNTDRSRATAWVRVWSPRSAFHLWTPPSRQGKTYGLAWRVVGCCHLSGL
jgi:hypothetical protein